LFIPISIINYNDFTEHANIAPNPHGFMSGASHRNIQRRRMITNVCKLRSVDRNQETTACRRRLGTHNLTPWRLGMFRQPQAGAAASKSEIMIMEIIICNLTLYPALPEHLVRNAASSSSSTRKPVNSSGTNRVGQLEPKVIASLIGSCGTAHGV
jgi:hypothetical protein